jgi:hypothetical protein
VIRWSDNANALSRRNKSQFVEARRNVEIELEQFVQERLDGWNKLHALGSKKNADGPAQMKAQTLRESPGGAIVKQDLGAADLKCQTDCFTLTSTERRLKHPRADRLGQRLFDKPRR